jgi:hypothetical protein
MGGSGGYAIMISPILQGLSQNYHFSNLDLNQSDSVLVVFDTGTL